jgi:hypothetical protein
MSSCSLFPDIAPSRMFTTNSCPIICPIHNGLQQIQMESCQPIKRLRDKKKREVHSKDMITLVYKQCEFSELDCVDLFPIAGDHTVTRHTFHT